MNNSLKRNFSDAFSQWAYGRGGPDTTGWFELAAKSFPQRRLTSVRQLLTRFDELNREEKFVAICYFRDKKSASSIPLLFSLLDEADTTISGIASGALSLMGGKKIASGLMRRIRQCAPRDLPINAISSLCNLRFRLDKSDVEHLIALANAADTTAEELSYLLDAIGNCALQMDRRTRLFAEIGNLMRSHRKSAASDIRQTTRHYLTQFQRKAK